MFHCFPDELLERYGHLPLPKWREIEAYYKLKGEDEARRLKKGAQGGSSSDGGNEETFSGE